MPLHLRHNIANIRIHHLLLIDMPIKLSLSLLHKINLRCLGRETSTVEFPTVWRCTTASVGSVGDLRSGYAGSQTGTYAADLLAGPAEEFAEGGEAGCCYAQGWFYC